MSDLPEGWSEQPLADVAFLKTGPFGSALKKSDYVHDGIPVVNPMHIADGAIYPSPHMTISDATAWRLSEFLLSEGDVVMGRRGEMGRCAVVTAKEDGWLCGSGSFIVRPRKAVDPRYLQRFLSSPEVVETLTRSSVGSTMVNLNQQIMKSLSVPLPPLAEQKRIADKLDALLARVDACRARLGRVPALLKRFRQAVLAAAVAGRLTEDCAESAETWQHCALGTVLTDIRYGTAQKSEYNVQDGTPVLRIPNIGDGRIDPTDLKYGRFSDKEIDTLSLRRDDLLLIRSNGSVELVGKVAVVEPEFEGYLYAGYLIRLRLDLSRIDPRYLYICLSSPATRTHIEFTARSTSGVNNINSDEIRSIQLPVPSLALQHEIVRRVETLFAYADQLEARLAAAQASVAQLTPSLLAKAFRGELVNAG